MTQENKELLLKDLCARFPYGVKVNAADKYISTISSINIGTIALIFLKDVGPVFGIDDVKPYLRPMSSMTEEEYGQYMEFIEWSHNDYDGTTITCINKERFREYLNFIYSHHLDDNNFIKNGLALELPEGMYKRIDHDNN